jgi:hypothetical protein
MQFQVPQFIETEDKVVGPLTFKQFGYIGLAALVVVLLFFVLGTALWLVSTTLIGLTATTLAFGKINGRPISVFLKALVSGIWKPKVYVFRPRIAEKVVIAHQPESMPIPPKPRAAPHHIRVPSFGGIKGLREWLATSKTAIPKRERPLPRDFGIPLKKFKERYEVVRHLTGEREVAKRVDYR